MVIKTEDIQLIKAIMYGKIDWIKVFKDAYEGRKTSWKDLGHIREWRNATDEILFAVWSQLEHHLKDYKDKNKMIIDIIGGFKKINPNIKLITCCPNSPINKCKEDLNGYCYYCKRPMLQD